MRELLRVRLAKGYTQKQVADRVGVTVTSYSQWETGRKQPHPKRYPKLAKIFEIDPYQLTHAVTDTPGGSAK